MGGAAIRDSISKRFPRFPAFLWFRDVAPGDAALAETFLASLPAAVRAEESRNIGSRRGGVVRVGIIFVKRGLSTA